MSTPSHLASHDKCDRKASVQPGGFLNRMEIEALQLEKLRQLLQVVARRNPFYARRLSGMGLSADIKDVFDYTTRYPFTFKGDLIADQIANPPYGTDLTYPLECYTRCHQTSGSTGEPLRWLDTPETWQHILDHWRQIYKAAGVTPRDRFIFAFSFGPFIGFWSAFEAAIQMGCFCYSSGAMTSLARLKAVADNRLTVLACTPTYALHLGEVAREHKMATAVESIRLIVVAGEPGGSIPATRARLAELWPNARVFDHYGMTEVGPVTYECPDNPGVVHVIESAFLPEIIDPRSGRPVSPGQTGELVLTTLDRLGSPLLRYRTGDHVAARPQGLCACGRHDLALEGGILGRGDDMVVVRGVNIFPAAVEEVVRRCGGINEYRVWLDRRQAMTELSLEIEPASGIQDTASLVTKLQQNLQDALFIRISVRAITPGSLPRFEMKSKRWFNRE